MPIPRAEATCRTPAPAGVSLPVLPDPKHTIRRSKMGPRRAAVLIAVHLIIAAHIIQWVICGMTLTPVEPSESMYTLTMGKLNAGFVFFVLAILSTLVLGRFFCGWGCHIVAVQDLCGWMMKKMGVRPKPFRSRLLIWAPLVLALYMFVWPTFRREVIRPVLGPAAWETVAPYIGEAGVRPEIRAAFMTRDFWETFAPWYIAIPFIGVCGLACVYFLGAKGFCTYGCPYGGFFGPADLIAVGRIRVTDACEHCGHCTAVCTSNVRVHEEVRDYGMVVDPGCMKCMDCVSVCPNHALYFGFGKPAVMARPRAEGAKFKTRVYDLSRAEDLAYGALFLFLVIGFRGLFGVVPLLMAMGLAGVGTFLAWKLVSMLRLPNVRIQSVQLKLKGRVRPAGAGLGLLAIVMLSAGAWGGIVNAASWRGATLDAQITTPLDEVLSGTFVAPEAVRSKAEGAAAYLRFAGPLEEGGFGWDRSVDRCLKLTRLAAMTGDISGAERELRRGLANAAATRHGVPGALEDPLVRLLTLKSGSMEAVAGELVSLLREYPELATARLSLARIRAMQGATDEAITLLEQGIAARPEDVRNLSFATGLLVQLGRGDLAVETLARGVKLQPRSAELRVRYGLVLSATGEVERGLREILTAAELDPANPEPAEHLGALYRELGNEVEATKWEERAKGLRSQGRSGKG